MNILSVQSAGGRPAAEADLPAIQESYAHHVMHGFGSFAAIGHFSSVGFKRDQWVDIVLMQRALGEGDSTRPEPDGPGPLASGGSVA